MNALGHAQLVSNIIKVGELLLPKASEDEDPDKARIDSFGCIPHTFEWLKEKVSALEPDDIEGIVEWQEYLIDKALRRE